MLKQKEKPEIKTVAEVKVVTSPAEAMIIDSDNDGLKDWEETLWKLDPHKIDSNEDGVSDAEEVKKRISQIDADALKKDSASDVSGSQYADDTETDTISKKLFAEYINLKQSGNFNENTINDTANRLVEEQLNNKKVTLYYSAKDIKTFPSENKALLKAYGNSLSSIRAKYVKLYLQNPLIKEGEVVDLVNPDFLKRLVRISDNFKNMAKEMSRLAVPKDLLNTHIEILNNYMANSDGLKEMSKMGTDPVMAMVGVQRQTEAEANEKPLFSIVAKNIFQNGVVYSQDESGYNLNNI